MNNARNDSRLATVGRHLLWWSWAFSFYPYADPGAGSG
jgi:hypothetical protein